MRIFAFLISTELLLASVTFAQTIDVTSSPKPGAVVRPALIGTGSDALINRIDTRDLIEKGQKDAAIMFSCVVKKTGEVVSSETYRGTPDSKLLERELQKRLVDAKFIPALYNRRSVDVMYYGTVTFVVLND